MEVTKRLDPGEIIVSTDPRDTLEARDLASGVAVCLFDAYACAAGIARVALPDSTITTAEVPPGVFADRAVGALMERMAEKGATAEKCEAALVGGASFLDRGAQSAEFDVGPRNVAVALSAMEELGLRVTTQVVGSWRNRHVKIRVRDGSVLVEEV